MNRLLFFPLLLSIFVISQAHALELVIGEKRVEPGIVFIFEGAIKDQITPKNRSLPENQTHIHIEARVNWDENNIPEGTPPGGFVPYLNITSKVTNQRTGRTTFIDLIPHLNLIDNFHYARNISLPGESDDKYTVDFYILKPTHIALSLHQDWLKNYGDTLLTDAQFTYSDVDFENIAKASR